ncbi:TerC family protein [Caenibacillus caldisaponilyticus]|uniref:TerC family protein n=1 Tax=Caenibacillus caldisaponilyticus TaxID=1674942 RepID=UPI00350E42FB
MMTWSGEAIIPVINIIFIDLMLGGDNAVLIAMACRKLPPKRRSKAIIVGTGLAVILRVLLTAIVLSLLQIPYLLIVGGLLLVGIAYRLIIDKANDLNVQAGTTFFGAVRTIVFADLIMGLDNILGIAGAAHGNLTLVVFGLCISVPIIIWGSKLILTALDHIPGLIYLGGAILAYTAAQMIISEPKFRAFFAAYPALKSTVTVLIIVGVLLGGWIHNHGESSRVY